MCNPVCVKCVYAWVMRGYCHSDSACFVSVRAVLYIFIMPSPTCKFLQMVGLCILQLTGTEQTKSTHHPSKFTASWCYVDPTWCARYSTICYLTASMHYNCQRN